MNTSTWTRADQIVYTQIQVYAMDAVSKIEFAKRKAFVETAAKKVLTRGYLIEELNAKSLA